MPAASWRSESGTQHQPMRDDLRLGRRLLEKRHENNGKGACGESPVRQSATSKEAELAEQSAPRPFRSMQRRARWCGAAPCDCCDKYRFLSRACDRMRRRCSASRRVVVSLSVRKPEGLGTLSVDEERPSIGSRRSGFPATAQRLTVLTQPSMVGFGMASPWEPRVASDLGELFARPLHSLDIRLYTVHRSKH